MTRDLMPTGYLGIHEAAKILEEVEPITEKDIFCYDTGDHLNKAAAIDAATKKIRQCLCDGEMTGYFQMQTGEIKSVPEWTWADGETCMGHMSNDQQFDGLLYFHSDGVEIDGVRSKVFLLEEEFEALRNGEIKSTPRPKSKSKRRPGRPAGVGACEDDDWILAIDKLVKDGIGPKTAANSIVAAHSNEIERNEGTPDDSVAQRLYRKWKATFGSPSAE
jgi:hypothetical protein